jgi:hypothetical protein
VHNYTDLDVLKVVGLVDGYSLKVLSVSVARPDRVERLENARVTLLKTLADLVDPQSWLEPGSRGFVGFRNPSGLGGILEVSMQ